MDHRAWLCAVVARRGYGPGVELGVKTGETLEQLLLGIPTLSMIGVDLWQPLDHVNAQDAYRGWDHDAHYQQAADRLVRFGKRAQLWRMDTADAAQHVESVDFVFIDADHTTAGVQRDIDAWWPKIRAGGLLCGDDMNKPSVERAVRSRFPDALVNGRIWWVDADQHLRSPPA